jgi:hypothetical protein
MMGRMGWDGMGVGESERWDGIGGNIINVMG